MPEAPTRTRALRLTEPEALSARLEELEAQRRERGPGPDRDVALAECRFRLAVHPETSPAEALLHLAEALRLDAVNPKYAYHIARIYWLAGDLEKAGEWLEEAFRVCPSSHRLWSQMSRLQFEMALTYTGVSAHANEKLRSRGQSLASAILAGMDTLEDAVFTLDVSTDETDNRSADSDGRVRSPADADHAAEPAGAAATELAPRIIDAGRCRWPGVADVLVWEDLAKKPTQQSLERVVPAFERIAAGHGLRPDGISRFAQLAIEWLVCGYPPDTVHRLREGVMGPSLALDLLDLVLDLYEMPRGGVPSSIARELTVGGSGVLPPLLAAVIHDRRVLWRKPAFGGYSAYRRARRLLQRAEAGPSKEQLEEAKAFTSELSGAVNRLVPKPPKRVADFRPTTAEAAEDSAGPEAGLTELESTAERLGGIRREMIEDAKRTKAAAFDIEDAEAYAKVSADRRAIEDLLAAFNLASAAGTKRLERVIVSIGAMDDGHDADAEARSLYTQEIEQRNVRCRTGFTDLMRRGGTAMSLKTIDERLQEAGSRFAGSDDAEPSPNLGRMLAEVRAFTPATERMEQEEDPTFAEAAEDSAGPEAGLTELESTAERLGEIRREMIEGAKRTEAAASDIEDAEAYAKVSADRRAIKDLLAAFDLASAAGTKRLERVIVSIGAMDDGNDADAEARSLYTQEIEQRNVRCRTGFTDLMRRGGTAKRLKTIDERLQEAGSRFAGSDDAEPSPDLGRMLAEVRAFTPATERMEQEEDPTFGAYDGEGRSGLDALEHVLTALDDRIEGLFGGLYDSFAPYETVIDCLPAMSMLRRSVRSAHAEMLYRMGRRAKARGLWQHSLREDRANPGLLHNIAVCDTYSRNVGRSLSSWHAYAEVLYYLDVVSGDPSLHAAERAVLHRSLAGAYGPSIEIDERSKVDADVEEVAYLLSNPARLRHFVDHYLLFALNEKLDRQNPYLVLGVKSSDSKETLENARDRLTGFVKSLAPLFPERVRDAFTETCIRRFEKALAVCVPDADIPSPPRPPEHELQSETDFLLSVMKQKYMLRSVLFGDGATDRAEGVAYAFQIPRLDEIPVNLSDQIGDKAAGQLGAHLEVFNDMFGDLLEGVIIKTFKSDTGTNPPAYRSLISACRSNPSMERVAELIDRPQFIYPEEVVGALKGENVPRKPAIEWLLAFARRFPSSTDPAAFAAQIMHAEDYPSERVIEVLSTAIANGFWSAGVCRCRSLRMQFAFEQGADAWAKRKDKDMLSKAWRLASEDAAYVRSHSEEENELEIAENILQRLEEVDGW